MHRTFLGIFSFILDLETLSKLILVEKRHVYVLLGCIKTYICNYKIIFFCIIPPVCLNTFRPVLQCISPSHIIRLLHVVMGRPLSSCATHVDSVPCLPSSCTLSCHPSCCPVISSWASPSSLFLLLWYHPIPSQSHLSEGCCHCFDVAFSPDGFILDSRFSYRHLLLVP